MTSKPMTPQNSLRDLQQVLLDEWQQALDCVDHPGGVQTNGGPPDWFQAARYPSVARLMRRYIRDAAAILDADRTAREGLIAKCERGLQHSGYLDDHENEDEALNACIAFLREGME
jgi:hypothetical protein